MNKRIKKKINKRFKIRKYKKFKNIMIISQQVKSIIKDSQPIKFNNIRIAPSIEKENRYPNIKEQKEWLLKELRRIHFSGQDIHTRNNIITKVCYTKDYFDSNDKKKRTQVYRVVKGQIKHGNFKDVLNFLKRNKFPNVYEAFNAYITTKHDFYYTIFKYTNPILTESTRCYTLFLIQNKYMGGDKFITS